MLRRWLLAPVRLVGWLILAGLVAWCALALRFDAPADRVVAAGLAGGFLLGAAVALFLLRPRRVAVLTILLMCGLVLAWWNTLLPSNERDWMGDVAVLPTATVAGDRLTVHNVRDFDYRGEDDYTVRYEDRGFELSKIQGLDLFLSYWGSPAIAHTILSWDFGGGSHLAVSIETRKEKGESYSALRGFFRQYELTYIVADERDLIRLRTNYRGEDVYLYRLKGPPARARAILLDYLQSINELAAKPQWYNALTQSCTTGIAAHVRRIAPEVPPFDWRLLVNGYADEMLYDRGSIDTSIPFAELKARSRINDRAKAADRDPAFSQRIRE